MLEPTFKVGVSVTDTNPYPVKLRYWDGASWMPYGMSSNVLPAGTDRSGSITAAGVAQDIAPANANRQGLTFQNTSDTVMRLTESGTDASASVGYSVAAGASVNVSTNRRISVFGAVAGKTFAATEYP